MDKVPRLTQDQRSNLIAYLDGELPEPAAKEIEHVLTKSRTAQHDVEMLSRTWEMLDSLPRLAGAADFTSQTVAFVKADESPRPLMLPAWVPKLPKEQIRRGAIVAAWVVGLALVSFAGFVITNRMIPNPTDALLRNLPVIEKLDLYSNVESIEFLRELDKRVGIFDAPEPNKR